MTKKKSGSNTSETKSQALVPTTAAAEVSLAEALERRRQDGESIIETAQAAEVEHEFLCMRLRERRYAIPIGQVAEVITPTVVTQVPHLPAHIRGVFNRHGKVTAVLDLAMFSGIDVEEQPKRMVVLEVGELEAAVPVTDIVGIISVGESKIEPPLPHLAHDLGFVSGQINFEDSVISVLDAGVLLENARHKRGGDRA